MSVYKKFSSFLLLVLTMLLLSVPALAAEGDIIILYTNDVHTYIDNNVGDGNEENLTYSKIAALKDSLPGSILVDAGDHLQGTAYGSMDHGSTITTLMNAAGYDLATLGNHEFDYGMTTCLAQIEAANFPYTSCNFHHVEQDIAGDSVLAPYVIMQAAGQEIAFVGITTPETFVSSTPAYFQNEKGEYIYGISGGADGSELYVSVQAAIDSAKAAGADYIIALGHLGVDPSSAPWRSRDVIANTTGLDAFIDGHSHTTLELEWVTDRAGETVALSQTGSYLAHVGQMTISSDGTISTQLLTGEDLATLTPNTQVKALEDAWVSEISTRLGQIIGSSKVTLDNYDEQGNRLVRKQETNTGDFAADALYYLFDSMDMDVDAAIVNGGGVRNKAISGELSYLSCKEIHTFGNVACLLKISGQQLLDALEWGAKDISLDQPVENGGFLQVSGLRYTIDPTIPSTVQKDSKGVWVAGPTGSYRVTKVEIFNKETNTYEPLDRNAYYHLAGYNYTLRDLGDGFAMFDGAVNILDYVAEDYMVLATYIQSFPADPQTGLPTIGLDSNYHTVTGTGRILFASSDTDSNPSTTYTVVAGDCLWNLARSHYGSGAMWNLIFEANRDILTDPSQLQVGQVLTLPAA